MSSSSDEDLSKFSEAADPTLFNNCLFSEDKGDHITNVPVKSSLRYLDGPDENRTDLKVTPGFQKHVASRLMEILDSSLDVKPVKIERTSTPEHDSNGNCMPDLSPKKAEGGIRLFGASAAFLASCNITPPPPTKRRKRGRRAALMSSASEDDSSSNEADISNLSNKDSPEKAQKLGVYDEMDLSNRFAACAVSSDWILNGDAVKGWAPPHKIKDPIPGEATPDLLKMTSFLTVKNVKHKKKKQHIKEGFSATKMEETEPTYQVKKRGKRGKKKKVKMRVSQVISDENFRDTTYKPSKRKKKRAESVDGTGDEVMSEKEIRENKISRALYKEFKRSVCEKLLDKEEFQNAAEQADLPDFPKKKKKKKKDLISQLVDTDMPIEVILKKMKKRKRRKERENEFPLPVLEDEGFDSDPTKADRKIRQQRKLLRAEIRKQKKLEKKWQNNMEYLSNDLANLMMAPVKED